MYESKKFKNLVESVKDVMKAENLHEFRVDPKTLPTRIVQRIPNTTKIVDPKTDKEMFDYVLKLDKQRKAEEITLDKSGPARGLFLVHVKMPKPDGEYTHAGYIIDTDS